MSCIWITRSRAAGWLARSAARRGRRDRSPTGGQDDEAHGHRGALSPAEHLEADTGPPDLPVPAALRGGRAAEPEPAPAKAGGSQFTGQDFTGLLFDNAIAISIDGKGAWRDNVFVERLWRSVKYEEVYLRAGACPRAGQRPDPWDSVGEARASIGRYLDFYNRKRPHSSLDARTPDHAYFRNLPQVAAA
jgi:hypothetical protein